MKTLSKSGRKQKQNDSPAAGRKTSRKFSIVQKIFLLALVVQICSVGSLKAQWLDYGDGTDGTKNVSVAGTYTDDLEDAVSDVSYSVGSGPPYVLTMTITTTSSSAMTWTAGQRILMVDMGKNSATSRNYDIGTIASVSGSGPYVLTVTSAQTNNTTGHTRPGLSSSLSPNNREVMRVYEWTNVQFSGSGYLTCHKWNGSTGGILAFCVTGAYSGELDLTGGTPPLIVADGMGEDGFAAHAGGHPGVAQTIASGNGYAGTSILGDGVSGYAYDYPGTTASHTWGWRSGGDMGIGFDSHFPTCLPNGPGGSGGCGAHASDGEGPFGQLKSAIQPCTYSNLFMAVGHGGSSGRSGQGAGAGGNGGGGGASYLTRSVSAGYPHDGGGGTAAGNGTYDGTGGTGGTGGTSAGMIYIKAYTIAGPGGSTVVISNKGSNNATNATGNPDFSNGQGGNGGNGGAGGDAYCNGTSFYAPGGGGGFGEGGNGAGGGYGGDGGPGRRNLGMG